MYKYSGYPEASLSFAEYIRANHAPKFTTVNNCIIFSSLATFLQVAKEEELQPTDAPKVSQFQQIAYVFADGSAITA
jgi:hypothetical protein